MTVPHQNHCLRDLSKNSMRVCEVHLIRSLLSNIWHFSSYYTCHFAHSLTCFHVKSGDPRKVTKDIISSKPLFVLKEYKEYSREWAINIWCWKEIFLLNSLHHTFFQYNPVCIDLIMVLEATLTSREPHEKLQCVRILCRKISVKSLFWKKMNCNLKLHS